MITIAILREAGLSDAQILRILEIADQYKALTGAERTRRWRARRNGDDVTSRRHSDTGDVTPSQVASEIGKEESNQWHDRHGDVTASQRALFLKEDNKKERKKESTHSRGTRLPTGWTPADSDWQFALTTIGEPLAKSNLDKFSDYWIAVPGQKGVKVDWGACWRNWVRRVAETTPAPPAPEPEGEWINGKSRWLHERELEVQRMLANGNHDQSPVLGGGSEIRGPELPPLLPGAGKNPSRH